MSLFVLGESRGVPTRRHPRRHSQVLISFEKMAPSWFVTSTSGGPRCLIQLLINELRKSGADLPTVSSPPRNRLDSSIFRRPLKSPSNRRSAQTFSLKRVARLAFANGEASSLDQLRHEGQCFLMSSSICCKRCGCELADCKTTLSRAPRACISERCTCRSATKRSLALCERSVARTERPKGGAQSGSSAGTGVDDQLEGESSKGENGSTTFPMS